MPDFDAFSGDDFISYALGLSIIFDSEFFNVNPLQSPKLRLTRYTNLNVFHVFALNCRSAVNKFEEKIIFLNSIKYSPDTPNFGVSSAFVSLGGVIY